MCALRQTMSQTEDKTENETVCISTQHHQANMGYQYLKQGGGRKDKVQRWPVPTAVSRAVRPFISQPIVSLSHRPLCHHLDAASWGWLSPSLTQPPVTSSEEPEQCTCHRYNTSNIYGVWVCVCVQGGDKNISKSYPKIILYLISEDLDSTVTANYYSSVLLLHVSL